MKQKKDKGFVITQEETDDKWFRPWAEKYLDEAFRQAPFLIDWSGNCSGYNVVVELKERFEPSTKYATGLIEASKWCQLINNWHWQGNKPVYCCKWSDDILTVWNIVTLPEEPRMEKMRAWNEELKCWTETSKLFLPMKDAKIYDAKTLQRIKNESTT